MSWAFQVTRHEKIVIFSFSGAHLTLSSESISFVSQGFVVFRHLRPQHQRSPAHQYPLRSRRGVLEGREGYDSMAGSTVFLRSCARCQIFSGSIASAQIAHRCGMRNMHIRTGLSGLVHPPRRKLISLRITTEGTTSGGLLALCYTQQCTATHKRSAPNNCSGS